MVQNIMKNVRTISESKLSSIAIRRQLIHGCRIAKLKPCKLAAMERSVRWIKFPDKLTTFFIVETAGRRVAGRRCSISGPVNLLVRNRLILLSTSEIVGHHLSIDTQKTLHAQAQKILRLGLNCHTGHSFSRHDI